MNVQKRGPAMGVMPGRPSNPEMYFRPNGERTLRQGRKDFPEE
jgi:hypothetical protein